MVSDSHAKCLSNRGLRRRNIAHSNSNAQRRRECSARHFANRFTIRKNVLALTWDSLLLHLEANPHSASPFFLQAHDRILAYKIGLLQTNNPVKPRFNGRSVLVNIIPIEAHSCFKTQNVSGTQPDGRDHYLSTTRQHLLPDFHRACGLVQVCDPDVDLETILTCIPAACEEA